MVPLGVDTGRYWPARRRTSSRAGPVRILCVARLAEQKGHHVLLAAVDELRRAGVAFHLRLVGDGPLRASLEDEVRKRNLGVHVAFEGARSEAEVRALYEEADVFVLTSFAEGMPVSIMEAMAMGIACVATHVGGTPELIRGGVDGLLVPPADVAAAAHALTLLASDEGLRARLGAAGRRRVLAAYEFDSRLEQLAEMFRTRVFDVGAAGAVDARGTATPRRAATAAGRPSARWT